MCFFGSNPEHPHIDIHIGQLFLLILIFYIINKWPLRWMEPVRCQALITQPFPKYIWIGMSLPNMVLMAIEGYAPKWISITSRYCFPLEKWRACANPCEQGVCRFKRGKTWSSWCWYCGEQLLPDRKPIQLAPPRHYRRKPLTSRPAK